MGGGAILAAALVACFFWTKLDGAYSGPSYEGRTLKQWIEAMESPNAFAQTQAIASVRSIGTNALPTLTDWMAHRDSDYQRRFCQLLRSRRVMPWLQSALMSYSAENCEYRALLGFYALGPQARPALPFLERLVRENDPANPAKPLNAAQAYVSVDPSQAERLAEQWSSSTNHDLITAGNRLKGPLGRVRGMAVRSDKAGASNADPATPVENSEVSGEGRHR